MFVSQEPGAFQELGEAGCCFKGMGAVHDSGQGGGTSTAAQGPFLSGNPEAHLLVFSPLLLAHKRGGDLLKVTLLEAPPCWGWGLGIPQPSQVRGLWHGLRGTTGSSSGPV